MDRTANPITKGIARLDALRRLASQKIRYRAATVAWLPEYRRLIALKDRFKGQRCFLVANGPSLGQLDLGLLANEHVCLVNMGTRMLESGLPGATFHISIDNNRYRRFAGDFEESAIRHRIPHRFYSWKCRKTWRKLPRHGARPHFLVFRPALISEESPTLDPRHGYTGYAAVVIFASELLALLGFREVVVIGCDLDYEGSSKYAYEMTSKDLMHEADPKVIERRRDVEFVNEQFGILRRFYEKHGRSLVNAGIGGNLHSLPRVDFASRVKAAA